MNNLEFSASIVCMDPLKIGEQVLVVNDDIDAYHFDFMDGIFVGRYGVYPEQIKSVRKLTDKTIEAHMMVQDPNPYLEILKDYGTDIVSFHYENNNSVFKTLDMIKNLGMKASLVLNLHTSVESIKHLIPYLDMIELMAINPGVLGSNQYMNIVYNKSMEIRRLNNKLKIAVDGGVRWNTINDLFLNFVSYQVAGSGILFNSTPIEDNLKVIRNIKEQISKGIFV